MTALRAGKPACHLLKRMEKPLAEFNGRKKIGDMTHFFADMIFIRYWFCCCICFMR